MPSLLAELGPIQYLGEFVFGIVVFLGLFGWIWFKPAVDRLLRDYDRVVQQRDDLIDVHEKTTLPVLKDVNDKIIPALTELADEVKALRTELSYLREERRR